MENIKVYIRIRKKENSIENYNINIIDEKQIILDNNNFNFDKIYRNNIDQKDFYKETCNDSINLLLQGFNITIFAYGSTGSGKTFTIFGNNNNQGITHFSINEIFENISKNNIEYSIKCSFLEIYKEKIIDLLNVVSENLKIRNNDKGIFVENLVEKNINNQEDIVNIINEGVKQRTVNQTSLNTNSSRSHSILSISIKQILNDKSELFSKLNIIDLAGSENINKSEVQGLALSETKSINKSLSCLKNVIIALENKNDHIPYRESKLTRLLQDQIGGNSKLIVISTINPYTESYHETLNTLKFSKSIKNIKNIVKPNRYETKEYLLNLINILKEQNNNLYNDNSIKTDLYNLIDKISLLNLKINKMQDIINHYELFIDIFMKNRQKDIDILKDIDVLKSKI